MAVPALLAGVINLGGKSSMEIIALIIAGLFAIIPMSIAKSKGRQNLFLWWLYGFFLFLIALIHALLMSPAELSD